MLHDWNRMFCIALATTVLFASATYAQPPVRDWAVASPGGIGDADAFFGDLRADTAKRALVVDEAGNSYVTGTILLNEDLGEWDFLTQKFAPDGSLLWSATYNGPGNSEDYAYAIALDAAGDVIVAGSTGNLGFSRDYLVVKYSGEDGSKLWEAGYDGPGRDEYAFAVAVDGNGDVVVTGASWGSGNNIDYATVKYSGEDGAQLWASRYEGPLGTHDTPAAIALDGNGDVLVTGFSSHGDTPPSYVTVKYSGTNGAPLWTAIHEGATSSINALAVDRAGDAIMTGTSYSVSGGHGYITIKYAGEDGAPRWTARYDHHANQPDVAYDVAVDEAGDVVVTGSSYGDGSHYDYATVKYSGGDGAPLWVARYRSPDDTRADIARAVALDVAGDAIVTGQTYDANLGYGFATVKYSGDDGSQQWVARHDGEGSGNDSACAVMAGNDGGIWVAGTQSGPLNHDYGLIHYGANGVEHWATNEGSLPGQTEHLAENRALVVDTAGNSYVTGRVSNHSTADYVTMKFAPNGSLLWRSTYNGPGNGFDAASTLVLDDADGVIVTGSSLGADGSYDYATVKYSATDGGQLWAARYDGPANGYAMAIAMAVDAFGDVAVLGQATGEDGSIDYAIVKYSGANGNELWVASHGGAAKGEDYPTAVVFDSSGDVVATGSTQYTSGAGYAIPAYTTLKYAGANGAMLWLAHYAGPEHGGDYAVDVALDDADNVVVTGYSFGDNSADYLTVKYSGADGAQLWDARYNGPSNGRDNATDVAIDGAGDVVVTGFSPSGQFNDFATVKYSGANGAQLWAVRYASPENRNEAATALVLDEAGDVVVTGMATADSGGIGNIDFTTVKYAGSSGGLLWEHRYDGGASGWDRGQAVALAPDGSLRIAGEAETPQGTRIVVIKLREAATAADDIFADDFEY